MIFFPPEYHHLDHEVAQCARDAHEDVDQRQWVENVSRKSAGNVITSSNTKLNLTLNTSEDPHTDPRTLSLTSCDPRHVPLSRDRRGSLSHFGWLSFYFGLG